MRHRSPARLRRPKSQWEALGNAFLHSLHQRRSQHGLGDLSTIDLRQAIIDEANSQGVPPGIALAVAIRESGVQQWRPDGSLVTGSAGEIGIFQLMPSTAAALGVDPTDPLANIHGGVTYLSRMYQQFGSWPLALAGYNWGPAKLQRALDSGKSIPGSVQQYVAAVLAGAGVGSAVISQTQNQPAGDGEALDLPFDAGQPVNPSLLILGVGGAILGVSWLLDRLDW